jgi:hypothetical protein
MPLAFLMIRYDVHNDDEEIGDGDYVESRVADAACSYSHVSHSLAHSVPIDSFDTLYVPHVGGFRVCLPSRVRPRTGHDSIVDK